MRFHQIIEVLGLTRDGVKEYIARNVREEKKNQVLSNLENNPHLMSVCGITFYCAALCTVLQREISLSDHDLRTYTRITSFIVVVSLRHHLLD